MVESNTSSNLFNLSDNTISALKKADLVQQIINLRGKVIVDSDLRNLCDQISNFSETITKLATANQQINSELAIVKMVNSKLEKRVIDLEKNRPSRNSIGEGTMWNLVIFQMIYLIINWKARLYRFAVSQVWRLIIMPLRVVIASLFQDTVEIITKGLSISSLTESIQSLYKSLYKKISISSRDFSNINIPSKKFMSVSLCSYYRFIWGKCKDVQSRGKIHQVFCLGRTVSVKLSESGNPVKIYHVADIPTFSDDDE